MQCLLLTLTAKGRCCRSNMNPYRGCGSVCRIMIVICDSVSAKCSECIGAYHNLLTSSETNVDTLIIVHNDLGRYRSWDVGACCGNLASSPSQAATLFVSLSLIWGRGHRSRVVNRSLGRCSVFPIFIIVSDVCKRIVLPLTRVLRSAAKALARGYDD